MTAIGCHGRCRPLRAGGGGFSLFDANFAGHCHWWTATTYAGRPHRMYRQGISQGEKIRVRRLNRSAKLTIIVTSHWEGPRSDWPSERTAAAIVTVAGPALRQPCSSLKPHTCGAAQAGHWNAASHCATLHPLAAAPAPGPELSPPLRWFNNNTCVGAAASTSRQRAPHCRPCPSGCAAHSA